MLKGDDNGICRLTDLLTQWRSLERGSARTLRNQHVSLPTWHYERKEDNFEVAYSGNCMIYLNRLRCHVAALLNLNCQYYKCKFFCFFLECEECK